jgi:predicted GTPase
MPYGDFDHPVQRFSSLSDLENANLTVEEREEYERHIRAGNTLLAGFDYGKILRTIKDLDVIIWDGGNNDFGFYEADLTITVVDPLRMESIRTYYPSLVNVRVADVLVVNKSNLVKANRLDLIRDELLQLNANAQITFVESHVISEDNVPLRGKRVLVVEDGPTVTHGGLAEGAGAALARKKGAIMVEPRKYCKGTMADVFETYPHIGTVLPALGYSKKQLLELEATINRVPCDAVILGTPSDLSRYIHVNRPVVRCRVELKEPYSPTLTSILSDWIDSHLMAQKA